MKTALILGITGGFGLETAKALAAHGWRLRGLHRTPEKAGALTAQLEIEWAKGDAMSESDVLSAAEGAEVIVHGVNPPGYKNWRELALPMLTNTISASTQTGARIVFPGNIYNYGPDAWPELEEDSPQNPISGKGAVRVEMETMLETAVRKGARALIVRAGDYYGPHAPGSWLNGAMVKPGKPIKAVVYPGRRDIGHLWAYLPDLGETVARLLDRREELQPFDRFNFGGRYFPKGQEISELIKRSAGSPQAPIKSLPWPALRLGAPFIPLFKEILEMRYLWENDIRLDNRKLIGFLGEEPQTDLERSMKTTLSGMGCV